MRRFMVVGTLFAGACVGDVTSPGVVSILQVASNASATAVFPGDQVQLSVNTLDVIGNLVPATITDSSSNRTVATINTTVLISALAAGTTSIGGAAGDARVSVTLVVDGNISSNAQLTPTNPIVAMGNQLSLSATIFTATGNPARGKSLTGSTSDASKAAVDQTRKVSGVAQTTGVSICAAATDAPAIKACTTLAVTP